MSIVDEKPLSAVELTERMARLKLARNELLQDFIKNGPISEIDQEIEEIREELSYAQFWAAADNAASRR